MICNKCKQKINENMKYCPNCGQLVEHDNSLSKVSLNNDMQKIFSIMSIVNIVIASIFAVIGIASSISWCVFNFRITISDNTFEFVQFFVILIALFAMLFTTIIAISILKTQIRPKTNIATLCINTLVLPIITVISMFA